MATNNRMALPPASSTPKYVTMLNFNRDKYPIPTCFNPNDRVNLLEVSEDGFRVLYIGAGRSDSEAAAIRSDHQVSVQCGVFYFEITIISKGRDGYISIGLCPKSASLNRLTGWESHSIGYHGDDGMIYKGVGAGTRFGPPFSTGDVVGCGIDFLSQKVFFTKNGSFIGSTLSSYDSESDPLYASIGLRTPNETIHGNFGHSPFQFDIENYVKSVKQSCLSSLISKPDILANSMSDQILVLAYLIHYGYEDSARALFKSISPIHKLFPTSTTAPFPNLAVPEMFWEEEGLDRQFCRVRIRKAIGDDILTGQIDGAIKRINANYPQLFPTNPELNFQLSSQAFIETIRTMMQAGSTLNDSELESLLKIGNELQKLSSTVKQLSPNFIDDLFSLLAYSNPLESSVAYLFQDSRREFVATLVDNAILEMEGESSTSLLLSSVQQLNACLAEIQAQGSPAIAFIDIYRDILKLGGPNA